MNKYFSSLIILLVIFFACKKTPQTPKPFGYIRIEFPKKQYIEFDTNFPYAFEYPVYGKIVKDIEDEENPYWINIEFPKFRATLHITYYQINNNLDTLLDDSHELVFKHSIKAESISSNDFVNDSLKVYATLFTLEGNAATPYQFHITDSTKNFLRGSFYFNIKPSYDSLYPFIKFFEKDIKHLIETFRWK